MKHIIYKETYYTGAVDANNHLIETTRVQRSKVYKEFSCHYPSGVKKMAKVWSTRLNKMVDIRLDIQLVEVID